MPLANAGHGGTDEPNPAPLLAAPFRTGSWTGLAHTLYLIHDNIGLHFVAIERVLTTSRSRVVAGLYSYSLTVIVGVPRWRIANATGVRIAQRDPQN
jgi:hypothetical protein